MMMVGEEEGDDDGTIELMRYSYNIIHSYKEHHQDGGWKRKLCQSIVPTILQLMEALPTYSRSGREMQVQHNLRLINGYLLISFRDMMNDDGMDLDWSSLLDKTRKSDIGQALACTEVIELVKRTFSGEHTYYYCSSISFSIHLTQLTYLICVPLTFLYPKVIFAPDVDTMTCNTITSIHSTLSSGFSDIAIYDDSSSHYCRFLFLGDESIRAARKTVHLIARVLGTKRSAFLIDDCFAEIFKSHSRACSDNIYLANEGIDRRRLCSGQCIFISELLSGSFKSSKSTTSMTNIFSSLASSVLPLIVSDSMWTLPTVLEAGTINDSRKGQSREMGTHGWNQTSNGQTACPSATIMNSNAVLISVMMGVIREFTHALGENMRLHLPILLFPILERASPIGNHSTVQRAAVSTLQDITHSIGYDDVSSLIASNFDYLVDAISLRLRKYGKENMCLERSCVGVIDLILCSAIHKRDANVSTANGPVAVGYVSIASNLLTCFLNYLDRQSVLTNQNILDATRILQSMCAFMESSIDMHLSVSTPVTQDEVDCDWLQRLDFDLTSLSAGHASDVRCDDDFVTVNDDIKPTDELLLGDTHDAQKNDRDETNFMKEVNAINTILSRCCYLLCYSNLPIQVICCETIHFGFRALGKIGSLQTKLHGESAINPLFRSIAEFWPSIIARLRSVSANLASMNILSRSDLSVRNIMATDQAHDYSSHAGLEVLMSKLLVITSELCMSSDGFFADRFENDAYPLIASLMTDLLSKFNTELPHKRLSNAAQKQTLLLSILHCFECTFESGCRNCLAGIIPATGAMLLPLLVCQGPVGDGATAALKAMLMVDSDALWREVHFLSGNPFPDNPIFTLSSTSAVTRSSLCSSTTVTLSRNESRSYDVILSERAMELLVFIECLPEQAIY